MRTLHQMMQDRGYDVDWQKDAPQYQDLEASLRPLDFADSDRAQHLLDQYEKSIYNSKTLETARVFWLAGKVGVNTEVVVRIVDMFDQEGDDEEDAESSEKSAADPPDIIILVQVENCSITSPAKKALAKMIPAVLETFTTKNLLNNITRHILQPKFSVLTSAEADEVMRNFKATPDQLPNIAWDDPVRAYYGMRVGQVLRCLRTSENIKTPYYRIVLPPRVSKKKK